MPQDSLNEAIRRLAALSAGDGARAAWNPVQAVLPELRGRVERMQEQWRALPAPLVAVLFGGTGTGKSTLLNALAGAALAETGERRPTTGEPTVYHPARGALSDLGPARYIASEHLDSLVLVDMPDTDSVRTEHAERVRQLLQQADVVLFCSTQQKYANEQSIALLRPLRGQRKIVCIQTRADQDPDIRRDWLEHLSRQGLAVDVCFRVSALAAFLRKTGAGIEREAFDFESLEQYLREKLPPERAHIKRENLEGAVRSTIEFLGERVAARESELAALDERLQSLESSIARETFAALQAQLINEPTAWVVALGDAVSDRAFGFMGTAYRVVHWLWMFPSRLTGKLAFANLLKAFGERETGVSAPGVPATWQSMLERLAETFRKQHAEANAYLARSGFVPAPFEEWKAGFVEDAGGRLEENLRPVNERLARRARRIAAWILPLLEFAWLAPFILTIGAPIGNYYYHLARHANIVLPEPGFLGRSAAMLAAVLFVELVFFAWLVRIAGRGLYRRLRREIQKDMQSAGFGFEAQRRQVSEALRECGEINELSRLAG
jgi:predicted GTPase